MKTVLQSVSYLFLYLFYEVAGDTIQQSRRIVVVWCRVGNLKLEIIKNDRTHICGIRLFVMRWSHYSQFALTLCQSSKYSWASGTPLQIRKKPDLIIERLAAIHDTVVSVCHPFQTISRFSLHDMHKGFLKEEIYP